MQAGGCVTFRSQSLGRGQVLPAGGAFGPLNLLLAAIEHLPGDLGLQLLAGEKLRQVPLADQPRGFVQPASPQGQLRRT